ncbi:MAG: hypothetical protein GF346_06215 [Candidatus Eisenbacteria bacterium]|nr:hypothetical protein [Candidatus Latescibacterota bacterium]MBD3302020.1 hypothetical protein [Candidatus Eisenbacteria bacterium]
MGQMGLFSSFLLGIVWLGLVIYVLVLATRFVKAVERIADHFRSQSGT